MADGQWGGYRKPSNPAAASGPGSLSQRTDGGPTDMPPLASQDSAGTAPAPPSSGGGLSSASPTRGDLPGLFDPTNRPDEPVTAGADAGPGIGMSAAGIAPVKGPDVSDEMRPVVARLNALAGLRGTTAETRDWVRTLVSRLGGSPLR